MFPRMTRNVQKIAAGTAFIASLWQAPLLLAANVAPPPITIEADEATLQEKDGASIYRGHVTLIQGGLRFDADEIRVESVNGKLSRMIASGSPVKYQQKKDGQKGIAAEAKTIEYLASSARAIFRGNAKLIQGNNSFSGDKIEYDTRTDTVKAGSREKERVKIVIQPNGVVAPEVNKTGNEQNPVDPGGGNSTPATTSNPNAGTETKPTAASNSDPAATVPSPASPDTKAPQTQKLVADPKDVSQP